MQIINRATLRTFKEVRLVGEGRNEIVSATQAYTLAEDQGLDLVLVSDQTTPPVVKIEDFKKLEYERKKARAKQTKASGTLKEVQLKVNISEHDLGTKLKSVHKFLERGDKVKVVVRLKGRERENPQRAHELIDRLIGMVDCRATRMPGPIASALLESAKERKPGVVAGKEAVVG